jgi:hypothetical protein
MTIVGPHGQARSEGGGARWLGPVAAAAAVVLIAAGVFVARPGDGSDGPPRLRLTGVAAGSLGESAGEPALGAPDGGTYGWGEWKVEGELPQGPSAAPGYRLPAERSDRAFVDRLASALGIGGDPQHLDGGWYLVEDKRELSVSERAGGHWVYADHGCVAGPVLDPLSGTACAIAEPGGVTAVEPVPPPGSEPAATAPPRPSPTPTPHPVSEEDARRVAKQILQAVGLDPAFAGVETSGDRRAVVLRPQVDGRPVIGLETRIAVTPDASVEDASGWFADPELGDDYPVIGAQEAFERLRDQPRPMLAEMPCEIAPGATACPTAPDRVVTGARLGLVQGYEEHGTPLLVPAWLFDVRDQPDPVVVVAVEPRYLGDSDEPVTGGGTSGSSGGGTGGSTGVATANPSQVEPVPPQMDPAVPATEPAQPTVGPEPAGRP